MADPELAAPLANGSASEHHATTVAATAEAGAEPAAPSPGQDAATAQIAPGYLATRLNTVFQNALAHMLKTCSYGNFAACFPTPAARRPDVLRSVWQQIVGKMESKARSEYEGIVGERDVVRGLNELEQLIAEARARKEMSEEKEEEYGEGYGKPVAPHTLPPQALFDAYLTPELEPLAAELRAKIEGTAAENDRLAADIERQRDEVEAMIKHLETVVKDLEGANEALESVVDGQDLRQEIMDTHRELEEVDSKL